VRAVEGGDGLTDGFVGCHDFEDGTAMMAIDEMMVVVGGGDDLMGCVMMCGAKTFFRSLRRSFTFLIEATTYLLISIS
jgi:hypothetical protein